MGPGMRFGIRYGSLPYDWTEKYEDPARGGAVYLKEEAS